MKKKSGGSYCENANKKVCVCVCGGGVRGRCVQRIDVIMQKKSRGGGGGNQSRCVQRIEVIVKMQKKSQGGGSRCEGSNHGLGVGWGVARLGEVGDVGYGGCKPRIGGIDK